MTLGFASGGKAHAAIPPDPCFSFDIATGTIEDYDTGNPFCVSDLDIPSTIGGEPVTSIGDYAFYSNQLASVTIPTSVTSIGDYAFRLNELTSVTIPNSVTTIGVGTFSSNLLTSVTIPNSVTTISENAFNANILTSLTLGNSVTTIGDYAFYNNQLASLTIPNSVTSIGDYTFYHNLLTSLTLGNSVTTIGNGAFNYNELTSVTIPNSVTTIGEGAFSFNLLTSLTLGNSVSTIGNAAFADNQLTSIVIPNSVTTIHPRAFLLNSSLDWQALNELLISGDPVQVQQAYDSIQLVHLFIADPANPNNLQDSIVTEADYLGTDENNNGNQADVLGSHLIMLEESLTNDSDSSGGELASTGQNIVPLALLAILTVTASAATVLVGRYKLTD